jgi:hypothetical protein
MLSILLGLWGTTAPLTLKGFSLSNMATDSMTVNFSVSSCSVCQYFYKILPQDISIMRPRILNSLTRKIDLYIEVANSLKIAFLQGRFGKKPHSEELHKFQPPADL